MCQFLIMHFETVNFDFKFTFDKLLNFFDQFAQNRRKSEIIQQNSLFFAYHNNPDLSFDELFNFLKLYNNVFPLILPISCFAKSQISQALNFFSSQLQNDLTGTTIKSKLTNTPIFHTPVPSPDRHN